MSYVTRTMRKHYVLQENDFTISLCFDKYFYSRIDVFIVVVDVRAVSGQTHIIPTKI